MNKPRYKLKDILAALKACGGQVNLAAKQLGCERTTIYARAKDHPIITETIAAIRDEMVDIAEVGLRKAILDGDLDAIKFALKTIGKGRGYTERTELTIFQKLADEVEGMSDEELQAILHRGVSAASQGAVGAGGSAATGAAGSDE